MADYSALIAKWATLSTSMTTAQKLAYINSTGITGVIPTSFYVTCDQLLNSIAYSEFKLLTSTQQNNLLAVCRTPGQLLGGSTNVGLMVDGIFLDYFTSTTATIANLTALAKGTVTPWWQASTSNGGGGLSGTVGPADLALAGGLT